MVERRQGATAPLTYRGLIGTLESVDELLAAILLMPRILNATVIEIRKVRAVISPVLKKAHGLTLPLFLVACAACSMGA